MESWSPGLNLRMRQTLDEIEGAPLDLVLRNRFEHQVAFFAELKDVSVCRRGLAAMRFQS